MPGKMVASDAQQRLADLGDWNWLIGFGLLGWVLFATLTPGLNFLVREPEFVAHLQSGRFGETIAVLMVVGNVPNIPTFIFDSAYPLPALIANNYGEMMSIPLYDAALLGAALVLLVVILIFNILSTLVLQRFLRRS